MKRVVSCFLSLVILCSLTACGGPSAPASSGPSSSTPVSSAPAEPPTVGELAEDLPERVLTGGTGSRTPVTLAPEALAQFVAFLDGLEIAYPHPEYFDLEPVYAQRLADRAPVTTHQNRQPVLRDGEIDQDLLLAMVQENNAAYFEDEDRNLMHTPIEDEQEIRDVIALISESIEYDLPKLSKAEQDRLNCLLGDLKIVRASGLSLAAVVMETNVLYVNPPMIDVGQYASDNENAYRNTLYHEAKHLLQSDCPCYEGAAYRQTGTMRLPDGADALDPFRNFWLIEGCAEKAACSQTGDAPMSYGNLVGYVESLDLTALLSPLAEDSLAVEDCTLRRDTPGLLALLGGEGKDQTAQVLRLLWGMEITQGYADDLGETLGITEDEFFDLRMEIKADCCVEIARCYYRNLALALADAQGVTLEDLYCLMVILEGDFYYHFETTPEELGQAPLEMLRQIEEQFLTAVSAGEGTDLEELTEGWRSYPLWQGTEGETLNASLSWLNAAKTEYLTQRAGADSMLYLPAACDLLEALYSGTGESEG